MGHGPRPRPKAAASGPRPQAAARGHGFDPGHYPSLFDKSWEKTFQKLTKTNHGLHSKRCLAVESHDVFLPPKRAPPQPHTRYGVSRSRGHLLTDLGKRIATKLWHWTRSTVQARSGVPNCTDPGARQAGELLQGNPTPTAGSELFVTPKVFATAWPTRR